MLSLKQLRLELIIKLLLILLSLKPKDLDFRNAINIGLPVIECRGISAEVETGDKLAIDFEAGKIENISKGTKFQVDKLPPFIIEILADGGLIENLRRRINKK